MAVTMLASALSSPPAHIERLAARRRYCRLGSWQRPCSLAGLLLLYEQNYQLMQVLIGDSRRLDEAEKVSRSGNCLHLYLQVLEQSRYTTTLCLSYRFRSDYYPKQPNLHIRLYHDARNAEVLSGLLHGQRYVRRANRSLRHSWRANRFLYKWLKYCLHCGHGFT